LRPLLLKIWLLIVAAALFINLGAYPLYDADEGRNGEVGREMAATNDYVMPRIDGMPYLDKPIVYFAAEAAAMEILGPTELAARLPAYVFTLLTALIVFLFARRVWGEDEALIAAIAFLSMPLTLAFARTVIFDSALAFFMTAATMAFYFAVETPLIRPSGTFSPQAGRRWTNDDDMHPGTASPRASDDTHPSTPSPRASDDMHPSTPSPRASGERVAEGRVRGVASAREGVGRRGRRSSTFWSAIAWAAMALGVLTKGPVAIAVPLLIAIPYAIKRKRFRALWSVAGIVLFVVIIAPWVWAVSRVVPDFLHYVLVTETAQRLATKALKRTGPPWYFIPYIAGGALPWFIPAALGFRRIKDAAYEWLWILIPFLFFSISQSKRPQYILPVMPAIALVAARFWTTDERRAIAARIAAVVFIVFGALILAVPFVHVKMDPEAAAGARQVAIPMGIATMAGGLAFIKRKDLALIAMTIPIIAIPITANPLMQAIAVRRSAKGLADQLPKNAEYVGVEDFTGSLAFYLRSRIDVVTPDAEEFTSNYIIRHYEQFANDARWPVKRTLNLRRGVIYIVRNNDAAHRAALERNGFRVIAVSPHHVAYR
jgi:4-amino-4-deoxy-L-arabinose transferase-like glycosyltransferase